MAITKIIPIKARLDHVLDYTSNENKTENKNYGDIKYQDLHNVIDYVEADYNTEEPGLGSETKYYMRSTNRTKNLVHWNPP